MSAISITHAKHFAGGARGYIFLSGKPDRALRARKSRVPYRKDVGAGAVLGKAQNR